MALPTATEWHDRILLVIPSINGGPLLERMLPSLRFKPANVLVLDQGSSDDTEAVCREAGVELLQLGRPHSYTEAGNIGARIARRRRIPFLCVANNDIVFRTDVLRELLAEMDRDPRLGIAAPSQVILDPANDVDVLARRVFWNLSVPEFLHDASEATATDRIEADFCELTCALIRMEAINRVGFLDNEYGFYHEDADFCFRLRQLGYGAAYLPRSQIVHYTSSTFGQRKQAQRDYLARNRAYFARKHLGFGVRLTGSSGGWPGEAATVARRLHPVLVRFGLVDEARPELAVGRGGPAAAHYLFTPQLTPDIPRPWRARPDRLKAILAPSMATVDALRAAGFASFHAPLGVDTDVFQPWGPADVPRRGDELVYLAVATALDKRPVDAVLDAWGHFATPGRRVRLILAGTGLVRHLRRVPDMAYRSGRTEVSCYLSERMEVHERPALSDADMAALYRSADYAIIPAGEGAGLALLEALACGTPPVFDGAGPVATLHAEVTRMAGESPRAGLLAALEVSERLSAPERAELATTGRYGVLGHATLRHTAVAIRHALEATQDRRVPEAAPPASPPPPPPEPAAIAAVVAAAAPVMPMAPPRLRLRSRLSSSTGRRLKTAATAAARFGTAWQESGLPAAVSLSARRLRRTTERSGMPDPTPDPAPDPAFGPVPAAAEAPVPPARQASPLLIGYIDAQLGIGQSLRGLALAMEEAGLPFGIYPFGVGVEGRRSVPFMTERYDEATPHDINIIEVSPAELPRLFANVSKMHFDGSYNILRTYWELARGPAVWRQGHGMDAIHEIWAPNEFCAEAFRDFFDGPITVVSPCLQLAVANPDRDRFGLDADVFYFMFSFDYHSFPERKNPLAVVRAFLAAFPDPEQPVGLVVKATGVDGHFPAVRTDILQAARADGRIVVVDESLSRDGMTSLLSSIDCYVSLHRSEGFGLGMAEAMALEKPVIATAYSGNAEFVTERTGYPVPFTLKPILPHEYVHTGGQLWAEPDEDACAAAMRSVVESRADAAARACAGRAFVEDRYGAAGVGRIVAERLRAIREARAEPT